MSNKLAVQFQDQFDTQMVSRHRATLCASLLAILLLLGCNLRARAQTHHTRSRHHPLPTPPHRPTAALHPRPSNPRRLLHPRHHTHRHRRPDHRHRLPTSRRGPHPHLRQTRHPPIQSRRPRPPWSGSTSTEAPTAPPKNTPTASSPAATTTTHPATTPSAAAPTTNGTTAPSSIHRNRQRQPNRTLGPQHPLHRSLTGKPSTLTSTQLEASS